MSAEPDPLPSAEKDARQATILGDVLGDHRPVPHGSNLVGCSCPSGLLWEWPDWRMHVGRAQVIALAEDAEHARAHGCVTSPGGSDA